jgi:hypothetical protein
MQCATCCCLCSTTRLLRAELLAGIIAATQPLSQTTILCSTAEPPCFEALLLVKIMQ